MSADISNIDPSDPESFVRFLKDNGHTDIRILEDGSFAALYQLLFTTALHTGLDAFGFEYRYCYEDPDRALSELAKLTSSDDVPTGWVGRIYGSGGAA